MFKITKQQAKNVFKKTTLPKYLLNEGINIVMPEKDAKAWLKALRSGEYDQIGGSLTDGAGGFCCLGVQQHCKLKGYVEIDERGYVREVPTKQYLQENGIFYANKFGRKGHNPYLQSLNELASEANDWGDCNFDEIADALERSIAVY